MPDTQCGGYSSDLISGHADPAFGREQALSARGRGESVRLSGSKYTILRAEKKLSLEVDNTRLCAGVCLQRCQFVSGLSIRRQRSSSFLFGGLVANRETIEEDHFIRHE